MSRSSNQRQQQQLLAQQQQQMADNDAAAAAAEMFDLFCLATTMRQILGLHRNICDTIGLRPAPLNEFYPKLKSKIRSWKAQALWKKFDARASHRAYAKGNACTGTRVLVIGAGPCGLRTAIEAQLLGAKVVVVEKRDRISRNNVLHLWPFVITDLRNLGAKKFYGKFCAGSIDHISIRQIQCILLKVALLLGVEVHEGVSFDGTIEPSEGCGWRAAISPEDHAVSHYEFDVLIGADGKRNTLEAFKRKEFRGKLAIAITANFINKKTEAEAKAEEISGVAFIFNQAFFKELYHTTGIDLENIVYYKDETHYFVMTAKKHSLIDKGVILQDFADPAELLASQNVNTDKLLDYAREAAEFSTKYQMPNLEFAVNHYGKPDVAMFDFTSMFAAESSSRVIVRKNYRLLQCLVGDSLLEPFWPTGSGCARGFLSSMDAAYAIKLWNNPKNSILGVLAQRESIYRLLAQTTPENLQRDIGSYTVDPATRYPNLNRTSVNMYQVKHLIDTDDKAILEHTFMDTNALQASQVDTPVRRKRRTGDTLPLSTVLLRWIKAQLHSYEFVQNLNEVSDCFTNGKVLCALINRYRPDLVDYNSIKELPTAECNELAFKILEKELKINRVMSGKDSIDLDKVDSKIWLNYLEQICEVFRGEIPHVKHPKLDVSELREKNRNNVPDFSRLLQTTSRKAKSPMQDVADLPHTIQRRSVLDEEKVKRQRKHETGQAQLDTPRRAKKRRSAEKTTNIEERQQRLKEIEENRQDRQSKRRMQRFQQTQNFYKSLHMLQANTLLRESDESSPFEDYSIYMYRQQAPIFNDRVKELERKLLYPDRERGISSAMPRGTDEQFSDRIKSMEQQITSRNAYGTEKKPKDLMRAIGKIDSNDWNVREIEKKIEQSKKTEIGLKGREKVPKWSKEQFVARQSKMSKPTRQDSAEEKFKEIDQTLKNLDKQLKEGSVLEVGERGKNKVASIAGQFVKKEDTSEEKLPPTQPVAKSNSKVTLAFKKQAASEKCHFCKQTVYLMEKISTEGLILHRSCLKCHHCHTNLRPGGYAFDRDDPEGRFYCTQHFRLPAKAIRPIVRKPGQRKSTAHGSHAPTTLDVKTPEKPRGIAESVVQLDLLDRGQTPERIEFENTDAMSDGEPSEEHIIDENEWSGRNFLQPSADTESDLSSSSDESDDDSESDIFEEANGSPIAQQTLQLATDWIGKQHYSNGNSDDSDDSFYDSSEGLADDGKDDTEGEEIKKAREMRREEVRLLPLPTNLPTDTETENQKEVVVLAPQDGDKSVQKNNDISDNENFRRDPDKNSITSQTPPPTKADIEKIEQNSDRRFSQDVGAISEKLYRLNNIMKLNKDLESMAKDNLVKSDILKKLSLKEKWLLDNSVSEGMKGSALGFSGEKAANEFLKESKAAKVEDSKVELPQTDGKIGGVNPKTKENSTDKPSDSVINGDDDNGDGLNINSPNAPNSIEENHSAVLAKLQAQEGAKKENDEKIASQKMEIEGILDIVKMMDNSYIEASKEPLPSPEEKPAKPIKKDPGQMIYDAEHKKVSSLNDALHQIEVRSFAGTMDTIKAQMVMPTVSQQATLDISKYFPNAKQEKQSSSTLNKTQKTLKDVDLTKYFPQSPVPQRKSSINIANSGDKLKKSQTTATNINEPPKAPPRRQKSIAAPSSDKAFSIHEQQLDGAIDIQKAPVVKPVPKKGGIKIVKKIVPKGTKAAKKSTAVTPITAKTKIQDEADKILDEILESGQEVRSPSIEYQRLFTEEKSPSEDISEKIEKILEETGIDLGLPPNPRKKLQKTKSLGEEEFKRTHEKTLSREDGDRPMGVQKILQRFESMSSIKSDESFKLRKTNFSSTCSSLNRSKESLPSNNLQKSKESLQSSGSLKSNSDSMSDLEKTMEYLKSEWRTEATNFLQKKRDTFYAKREEKKAEEESKKKFEPEPQWKHTKYSKFFGIKEKSPEKRKSPTKSVVGGKRKSPAKILKKSPREEIMKHRKKIESVSSRTASFEEKIKAEEERVKGRLTPKAGGSQKDLTNGQENKNMRRGSGDNVTEKVVPSKIPIGRDRKDSQKNAESTKHVMDTTQKILSRRGSDSSGLADVLKPPVFKGLRGQQENKNKSENKKGGSQETLKTILNLVRSGSQSNVKDEIPQAKLTSHSPKSPEINIKEQISRSSPAEETSNLIPNEGEGNVAPQKESAVEVMDVIDSLNLADAESGTKIATETAKSEQNGAFYSENVEVLSSKFDANMDSENKNTDENYCLSESHSDTVENVSSNQNNIESETFIQKSTSPIDESVKKSQNQTGFESQTVDEGYNSKNLKLETSPVDRKASPNETSTQGNRKNSLEEIIPNIPSQSSLSVIEDSSQPSEATDDVDEIFNKIITELSKDEEESFNAAQELSLIAIAAAEDEEEKAKQPQQLEQQQITDESEYIAQIPESPKRSRANSEDSIEELFSHFTNDMLVDVEFDSNDEVVAITPRAVLVNDDDKEDHEEDSPEKTITVEEAKLKFEPKFPRKAKPLAKSSSSSQSISPGRTEEKRKEVFQKLDPANIPPSIQDLIQEMLPREESEPKFPVAFPRRIYYDEYSSDSSKSRTQTPDSAMKTVEPSTKEKHLEVVYELARPKRRRTPSPIPESARPPIKPRAISRENSERPISRRSSANFTEEAFILKDSSIDLESSEQRHISRSESGISNEEPLLIAKDISIAKEDCNNKVEAEKELSQEIASPRGTPKTVTSPRQYSRSSSDVELVDKKDRRSMSRRSSKSSLKDNEEIILVGSPALLPTPRRGSRASVDSTSNENQLSKDTSIVLPASSRKNSTSNSEVGDNPEDLRSGKQRLVSISPSNAAPKEDEDVLFVKLSSPSNITQESSELPKDSRSPSIQLQNTNESLSPSGTPALLSTSPQRHSTPITEFPAIDKSSDVIPEEKRYSAISTVSSVERNEEISMKNESTASNISREDSKLRENSHSPSLHSTKRKDSNISNEIDLPAKYLNEQSTVEPLDQTNSNTGFHQNDSDLTAKAEPSQDFIKAELNVTPRKNSDSSNKYPSSFESSIDYLQRTSTELRQEMPREKSREGSKTSTKSPSRAEGMVNIVELLSTPESLRKSESPKSIAPSFPESPQSARARFFAQNNSTASSPRDSKDRQIPNNEPSKEFRDHLRSKLESPTPRKSSQSRERSLEWDMEQLPKSPMPRRKYLLLHKTDSDKEDSPKRAIISATSLSPDKNTLSKADEEWDMEHLPKSPMPRRKHLLMQKNDSDKDTSPKPAHIPETSQSPGRSAPDIRIPTKRLEEWEIIEQLERERRHALIARDRNYSHQIQEVPTTIDKPIIPPNHENLTLNRLDSDVEPHSSKLLEYIKQETLRDSIKSKDDSPKPPSRPRTPQLSKRISSHDSEKEKQVAELKTQETQESPVPVHKKPPLQKPESVEATYEDFARFTRRSPEKDADHEQSDVYESPTASVSHYRPANYRHKSQESASGTYSPTSSLSRSIEHIGPSRPHRNKSSTIPENRVDRDTKYLMDRSKHLRNLKRDFMEEKIAGNNPYLKKVIEAQKVSRQDSDEDEDVEVDYTLESYRPKNHTTPRFPTSSSLSSRRRNEPRYPDYSSTTDYTSRRPYNTHFSPTSTSSSVGSRNFVDYFKRSPPHYKGRESSKDSCVQSDSESSSADDVELNSATEISTDSEFDQDEIIREAPKIFIDDTHLRKPTKVQIKQTVIAPSTGQPKYHINQRMTHTHEQPIKREPQFKPLVQVDPSLLSSNRMPLQNPRPGDYLLNKTASTEGIASKKSLELKKRYLLGEQGNGNKIQKSGSTSILDSKIRSFHSNISECQKLLNAGSIKPFLDRTKANENQTVVDKKIEITIKKTAIDEKENVFVNSKNELNKGMEYSETVNTTLVESLNKNKPSPIIETIDLISPEKSVPIIDLTEVEIPSKMLESNMEFIKNLQFNPEDGSSKESNLVPDNKIIDLTLDSPAKSDKTVIDEVVEKPDVSKDAKEAIPDIITHIEEVNLEMKALLDPETEKKDSPEKTEYDIQETSIQVPNIPWVTKKSNEESDSLSSSSSSSVEDIQHFILESTTSPDTQTGQIVPRLEVHDSSGTLMQIDSLMIIDGKYIGDPEDLKNMEIPPGIIIPEIPTQSPSPEEPITEKRKEDSPPPQKPELKFDSKNENKIDTLKNIPLILEKSEDHSCEVVKPDSLSIQVDDTKGDSDNDKTPTAEVIARGSDSDAEVTNQGLTETELSDWTADDAISENFIDLEFVLNSNKGTIKRNKKTKKKAPLQSSLSITHEPGPQPEQEPCGILKNLDIEEIEFMDTGSEGSCAEAYSATNTALLRNRGYVDYTGSPRNYPQNRAPTEYELKTPVNECPTLPSTVLLSQKSQSQQTTTSPPKQSSPSQSQYNTQSLSQSLTDCTNDIDEDSLCILTHSNGATANNTATITTTTEESEALTVVTSPMDSSSPKTQENFQLTASSSEQVEKTTSPSSNTTATPVTSSSSKGPTRKSSHEDLITHSSSKRKESEEMSYEEYVRKLQQKITQISNARDSIDVRKQGRRKSSKGEGSEANSVIESTHAKGLSVFEGGFSAAVQPKVVLSKINVAANESQDVHKVPVIPTLSSKLEELTKERTKQKDLIHDLVMDKLQCKKQLNAEKRLNRSRNRSMFGNNLTSSSLSPTPKMMSTNTSPYHVTSSSGGDHSGSSCKENNPISGQKIKNSPKEAKDVVQMFSEAPPRSSKQRPFSENFDPDSIDDKICKLSKTQSFTYSSRGVNFPLKNESNGSRNHMLTTVYASPLVPSRQSRKDEPIGTASNAEKLRTEARARARLKSNQDLGLSPEEKLQLLRKRFHLDLQEASAEAAQMKSEELRARDRKMISSKSVNDIATAQLMTLQPDENSNTTTVRSDLVADFTSDPNLSQVNTISTNKVNRRQKDPERRKSIIQTFSSFFQKGNKKDKDNVGPVSGTEKSGTSQSSAATVNSNGGGGDGMFSRFRISPKSKEKSKDNGSSPSTPVASTPQHQYRHHHDQRSNSQDCIAKQKYQKISSYASSPQLFKNTDEQIPPPIPPLPLNYQRSDDESYATESREQKKQRAITKATRQAELKRLRIAQEIQREQEEIEVQLKELEARGVLIEKALRGEGQNIDNLEASNMGANDEKLLKELLEIWRNITQLKKRDEELGIRQQELQLEHRHAQLKEELNIRLSGSKLDKSSADVAAEGAILNEMLEIVAKRAALRPTSSASSPVATGTMGGSHVGGDDLVNDGITFRGRRSSQIDESDI